MKKVIVPVLGLTFAAALVFTSPVALAHTKTKGTQTQTQTQSQNLNRMDKNFIHSTAQDGIAEVQISQLAREKATNPEVKNFANQMYTDHVQANAQLKNLAEEKGVQPPVQLSKNDAKEYKKLRDESGAKFDRAYLSYLIKDHKNDIAAFQKQAKDGKDADLKNWASEMVPKLEHHLMTAQSIDSRLTKGKM